ncbi:hypothetical protein K438DRAFT_1875715 [Mycena galopus ATCC 62051]|nr:hypothetical protein K438DRAFT_1875715 [Mycena galopus ATCC 62051]
MGRTGGHDKFVEEARFAGAHELGMALRWGLSRVVRVEGGREVRGLLSWAWYERWRAEESGECFSFAVSLLHCVWSRPFFGRDLDLALAGDFSSRSSLYLRVCFLAFASLHLCSCCCYYFGFGVFGLGRICIFCACLFADCGEGFFWARNVPSFIFLSCVLGIFGVGFLNPASASFAAPFRRDFSVSVSLSLYPMTISFHCGRDE